MQELLRILYSAKEIIKSIPEGLFSIKIGFFALPRQRHSGPSKK
ncbi:hypothetical protein Cabys_3434 [Caldithrix abyssi DSM 13497]|uniref:Uncharacterized protein n=1 Tax=Caldithrix abyssi DSM 13497 TaxID=880073 RepID=A0A1J1CCR8_CALAY|nr:hypothetical protein Cabys_3434 [Caldithrix abyssi DSM 13497]